MCVKKSSNANNAKPNQACGQLFEADTDRCKCIIQHQCECALLRILTKETVSKQNYDETLNKFARPGMTRCTMLPTGAESKTAKKGTTSWIDSRHGNDITHRNLSIVKYRVFQQTSCFRGLKMLANRLSTKANYFRRWLFGDWLWTIGLHDVVAVKI